MDPKHCFKPLSGQRWGRSLICIGEDWVPGDSGSDNFSKWTTKFLIAAALGPDLNPSQANQRYR